MTAPKKYTREYKQDAVRTLGRAKDDMSRTGRTPVREPASQQRCDTLAVAHSPAIARLSQDIADAVRALDRVLRQSHHSIGHRA